MSKGGARVHFSGDWARIASLYAELARVAPSPVVTLNRAVAVSMSEGPLAGLAIATALACRHVPKTRAIA